MNHEAYMRRALELAERGTGCTSPNPMVGAVVVKDGRIVGEGWHKAYGQAHAEVNALAQAGEEARGATLYVTLEPCNHTGKTPPCTDAVLASGISHVVMAMKDPNPKVSGGGAQRLQAAGVQVTSGVLEDEALRLNETFVKYVTTGLPFVTVKIAATLDGRIATRTGDARWISSEASRNIVHRMRHAYDAILVGVDTVLRDNPMLTTRIGADALGGCQPKNPLRIVLDTHLRIDPSSNILHHRDTSQTWLVAAEPVVAENRKRLERENVRIIPCPIRQNRIDLHALMPLLGEKRITSLLVEGGSRIVGSFLRCALVDKFVGFYAPKMLMGDDGVPICSGPGVEQMADCLKLKDIAVSRIDQDVMIIGYVESPHVYGNR
jgi:diaminohydroxyphosphoribosylaminopyrimidine deaminase/5-amino-6-(5-phosphoribosylamino)uracil reductase